jgi:hypothetical protein
VRYYGDWLRWQFSNNFRRHRAHFDNHHVAQSPDSSFIISQATHARPHFFIYIFIYIMYNFKFYSLREGGLEVMAAVTPHLLFPLCFYFSDCIPI